MGADSLQAFPRHLLFVHWETSEGLFLTSKPQSYDSAAFLATATLPPQTGQAHVDPTSISNPGLWGPAMPQLSFLCL